MAVKLRLVRMGKTKQPTYRIVAADSRSPRNGKFIELLERSQVFEKVVVSIEQKTDPGGSKDVELTLTTDYYPQRETR